MDVRISKAVFDQMVEALTAAHYEAVCMEPRLPGSYASSQRSIKEKCKAALVEAELATKPTNPAATLRDLLGTLEHVRALPLIHEILDTKLSDGCAADCARVLIAGNEMLTVLDEEAGVAPYLIDAMRGQIDVLYHG